MSGKQLSMRLINQIVEKIQVDLIKLEKSSKNNADYYKKIY